MTAMIDRMRWISFCVAMTIAANVLSAAGQELFIDVPVAVAADAAIDPADAANAGGEDPRVAMLRSQLEPMLKAELSFAKRVCKWSDAERVQAIRTGKAWLDEFARDNAKNDQMMNQGMAVFMGNAPRGNDGDLPQPEAELAIALEEVMTADQRKAYEAERAKRDAFRTAALVDNITIMVDDRLELSPQQRTKIRAALRESWDEQYAPPFEMFVQMSEYVPVFSEEKMLPLLTPEQQTAWAGVQKIWARGGVLGRHLGGMFGGNFQPIDDINLREGE
jgi:hypothetical protein